MNYELETTPVFDNWLSKLKDKPARYRIAVRLSRVEQDNFGNHKSLADQLFELRFVAHGGLRLYYTIRNGHVVILLTGGNKLGQDKDIAKARKILDELE
ncbi:MAG: type II toxin-antitoxin system RelE/ParE family toxin [Desulfuromusa sp.]